MLLLLSLKLTILEIQVDILSTFQYKLVAAQIKTATAVVHLYANFHYILSHLTCSFFLDHLQYELPGPRSSSQAPLSREHRLSAVTLNYCYYLEQGSVHFLSKGAYAVHSLCSCYSVLLC